MTCPGCGAPTLPGAAPCRYCGRTTLDTAGRFSTAPIRVEWGDDRAAAEAVRRLLGSMRRAQVSIVKTLADIADPGKP